MPGVCSDGGGEILNAKKDKVTCWDDGKCFNLIRDEFHGWSFVKIYWTVNLKCVHFIILKWSLTEVDLTLRQNDHQGLICMFTNLLWWHNSAMISGVKMDSDTHFWYIWHGPRSIFRGKESSATPGLRWSGRLSRHLFWLTSLVSLKIPIPRLNLARDQSLWSFPWFETQNNFKSHQKLKTEHAVANSY